VIIKNNTYKHMKKTILFFIALLIAISALAQQGINYKAIIKDNSGNVVTNDLIQVQFSIRTSTNVADNVYVETHSQTTDANGLIILNIGEGGATTGVFTDIDWANNYYLNVHVNTGAGLVDMGTIKFMAVPYTLHAERTAIADNVILKIDNLTDARSDADGSSFFLGENAGILDDGSDNRNIGVGANALNANTSGSLNVATGSSALSSNTAGFANTAIGYEALRYNTTASSNTATGFFALRTNTTGGLNVATGSVALFSNTIGYENTAIGTNALSTNTEGYQNSAFGTEALQRNTTGYQNTAIGSESLHLNTTGSGNTVVGFSTMRMNTVAGSNTAIGIDALSRNTIANNNTAIGNNSLYGGSSTNTTGSSNTGVGLRSLENYTSGADNTAVGSFALNDNITGVANTAIGNRAISRNTTDGYNVAVGRSAIDNNFGTNNIGVGYMADLSIGSNQVRIGNTAITYAGIQVPWTVTSDRRWKENIRKLPYGLQTVMELNTVDYTRKDTDSEKREMGFIAQDLEDVLAKIGYMDQGFLTKDDDGYLSVRYNDLIALLTKAIQERQNIIDTQNRKIETFEDQIVVLSKRLKNIEAIND
jgi:hypothetical protein